MKRILLYGTLIALVVSLALAGCNSTQPTPVKPTPTAVAPGTGTIPGQRVIAEGRVKPLRSAELSFTSGGIVSEVLVIEGQQVKKNQPLARLNSQRQSAAVAQSESALARAKAAKARAQATLAASQASLAQIRPGGRVEEIALGRAALLVAEADLARVQAGADPAQLTAARAAMDKAARAVLQAQATYDSGTRSSGGPDALRLEQTTIDYQAARAQYDLLAQQPRDTDLAVAKARVVQAQAALGQASAGGSAESLKAAEAAIVAAEAELASSSAEVAAAEASLAQARAALADTELRAPFDGVAVTVGVKAGEAAPAQGFAVRFADLTAWQVETTDLTELNVIRVSEGTPVSLTFDAVPGLDLTGKVVQVKPYGEIRQGDVVYTVVVAPDKQDARLRWNMTAKVGLDVK